MSEHSASGPVRAGLTEDEMRANVIRLAFAGEVRRFQRFCETVGRALAGETAAVLRGSSVTGTRWEDGAGFDADGPHTSDLDLTFVGSQVLGLFDERAGFYVPGIHTRPLCDAEPDIAPSLVPLRRRLMEIARRPVNIQATRDFWLFLRERLQGQPYLTIVGRVETEPR